MLNFWSSKPTQEPHKQHSTNNPLPHADQFQIASVSSARKKQREAHICFVCDDFLTEPRFLTCSHYFCTLCIEDQVSPGERVIKCPECGQPTTLDMKGVFGLQKNEAMTELIRQLRPSKALTLKMVPTTILLSPEASTQKMSALPIITLPSVPETIKLTDLDEIVPSSAPSGMATHHEITEFVDIDDSNVPNVSSSSSSGNANAGTNATSSTGGNTTRKIYEVQVKKLAELGFTNTERCNQLLQEHNGDFNVVLDKLFNEAPPSPAQAPAQSQSQSIQKPNPLLAAAAAASGSHHHSKPRRNSPPTSPSSSPPSSGWFSGFFR